MYEGSMSVRCPVCRGGEDDTIESCPLCHGIGEVKPDDIPMDPETGEPMLEDLIKTAKRGKDA